MNWFTKKMMTDKDIAAKTKVVNEWGGCKHVEDDPSKLYVVHYENDSFGREGYCMCGECNAEREECEGNKLYICVDCNVKHPLKDMLVWKWYDLYAAQGDEPLHLCKPCYSAPKHQARIRKDQEDRDWELGKYNPDAEDY